MSTTVNVTRSTPLVTVTRASGLVAVNPTTGPAGASAACLFADATARGLAVPAFVGQLGLQLDTVVLYRGTALTAGSWTAMPAAAVGAPALAHGHTGTSDGSKLAQANTHESADTDSATSSLHHTIGSGANNAAAGNHGHAEYQPLATLTTAGSHYVATAAGVVAEAKCLVALPDAGAGAWAPALTADAHHTVTRTGIWTSINPTGLEIGQGCSGVITGAYATTTTGVTADFTGALSDIAGASVGWIIWREASGYRMVCWTKA